MESRGAFQGTVLFSKAPRCPAMLMAASLATATAEGKPGCLHVIYKYFISAINQTEIFYLSDFSTFLLSVILTYPRYAAFSLTIITKYLLHLEL